MLRLKNRDRINQNLMTQNQLQQMFQKSRRNNAVQILNHLPGIKLKLNTGTKPTHQQ